jgi:hypothetical protein
LKPGYDLMGARVETTWVPGAFQLWVRGSQRAPPHLVPVVDGREVQQRVFVLRGVAVHKLPGL